MYNYRKKNIIIIAMICMVMFMSLGYALLLTTLNVKGTSDITGEWDISITEITSNAIGNAYNIVDPAYSDTTMTFNVGVKVPGDKMVFNVTVTNGGNIDAKLASIDATVSGSNVITYKIEGINNDDVLAGGTSKTFTISTEFDINATTIPIEPVKDLTVTLNYVQYDDEKLNQSAPVINNINTLAAAIKNNNAAQSDSSINFGAISSDTNGKGLYYTNQNTQNGGTAYYFRGAVDNNYVVFGKEYVAGRCTYNGEPVYRYSAGMLNDITDEATCKVSSVCTFTTSSYAGKHFVYSGLQESTCITAGPGMTGSWTNTSATWTEGTYDILWRIVRINEDGSIRLIKEESLGNVAYHSQNLHSVSTGYMYGTSYENPTNDNNSTIKTYLDSWYEANLKTNYSSYLADAGFCNDRDIPTLNSVAASQQLNAGYDRLVTNKRPMFKCGNTSRDLFTTESASFGNKALTYPIGLLTADEASYAGYVFNVTNTSTYLNNNTNFWTMTPAWSGTMPSDMFKINGSTNVSSASGGGKVNSMYCHGTNETSILKVRPVINILGYLKVTNPSDDGTKDNPYVIKTN